MHKKQIYVIGSYPVPDWCKDRIMPYRKPDGSLAYEFYGTVRAYECYPGNILEYENGRIKLFREKVGVM